jgi:hypothetical protein
MKCYRGPISGLKKRFLPRDDTAEGFSAESILSEVEGLEMTTMWDSLHSADGWSTLVEPTKKFVTDETYSSPRSKQSLSFIVHESPKIY